MAQFNLDQGIEEKCDITIAKAILEKLNDNDLACDVIVNMFSMMSPKDKQWVLNSVTKLIP